MPERLGCRRMRAVRELRVETRWDVGFGPCGAEVSEEMLKAMARHPGLRVVVMSHVDLSLVDPGLLTSLVARLEEVGVDSTKFKRNQVEAIMTAILAEGRRVKKLNISWNNLSTVDPNLLARVLTGLQEVKMFMAELTVTQMEAILTAICAEDCLVKKLDISYTNLSSVDPGLLARAVNRLEEVKMSVTYLTTSQVEAVLRQSLVQTSLRKLKLELDSKDNSELDEGLEARARLAIGYLHIYDSL